MRKVFAALIIPVLMLAGCINGPVKESPTEGNIEVVTSFYTMFDFAKKVGGDKADIINMVPAGTEPHDWEPSSADIVRLENADVFIYNGAGMETWVPDVLSSLVNKKLLVVEASYGIVFETKEAGTDPHVWLNPENAKIEMRNIKDAFVISDPKNASYYENNYNTYAAQLDILHSEFRSVLSACPKKDIVVSHEAFAYLCAAYGLRQVAIEGMNADSEPDPATMVKIVDFIKENNIKIIFSEELVSPKVALAIASQTGAKTSILSPLEGLSESEIESGDDYFSVMRKNLKELKGALS